MKWLLATATSLLMLICLAPFAAAAQELDKIELKRVTISGQFRPEAGKGYLMVESRNARPLITFVKAADKSGASTLPAASGYIEIPRDNRIAEGGEVSLWLFEVPIGDYYFSSIAGFIAADADCACMGSVRFSVTAGKVTAIRVETAVLDRNGRQIGVSNRHPHGNENDVFSMRGLSVGEPTSGLWRGKVDSGFVEPAHFSPVPELPNWFGHQINRVMPIQGILDYDHDRLIDLRKDLSAH